MNSKQRRAFKKTQIEKIEDELFTLETSINTIVQNLDKEKLKSASLQVLKYIRNDIHRIETRINLINK